jgi:hypothetical protein
VECVSEHVNKCMHIHVHLLNNFMNDSSSQGFLEVEMFLEVEILCRIATGMGLDNHVCMPIIRFNHGSN